MGQKQAYEAPDGGTYEVQIDGSEWFSGGEERVLELLHADREGFDDLLLTLFESGATYAALDLWEGHHYHNVKIRINRKVP